MHKLTWIAAGGVAGALLRYGLAGLVQRATSDTFPTGTLAVNVLGCLAVGFLGALFTGPVLVREEVRVLVLVGLLGSFTTFSTFGWETLQMLNDGAYLRAGASVAAQNVLGLAGVWIGYRAAQAWLGT